MRIYQTKNRAGWPWLFAIALFLLALGLTTAEVYGFSNTPRTKMKYSTPQSRYQTKSSHSNNDWSSNHNDGDGDNPPQVPEPTTLLLLGSGIAAGFAIRKTVQK